jgi:hypothetical protein
MGTLIVYMDPGIHPARADSVFRAAQTLGIRWVRTGFIWALMNPQKDHYELEETDRIIHLATQYGLSLLPTFTWTPLWATSNPHPSRYMFHAPTPEPIGNYSAGLGTRGTGYDYLALFAETVSRRYKNQITHWELWNEPDMNAFFSSSPAEYSQMLHYFSHAVKKGNPQAQILYGGLAQGEKSQGCNTQFFQQTLDNTTYPAHNSFDIYNFHLNFKTPTQITRQISENEALLAANHLHKEYWITEVSYTSHPAHQTLSTTPRGEQSQADYLASIYREALLPSKARVILWAALHDYLPATEETDPYKYSGLHTWSLTPKPAADTLKNIARSL